MSVSSTSISWPKASSSAIFSGSTTSVNRSCDSLTKISQGRRPGYFRGTFSSSTTAPPLMPASSPTEDERPPAPLSVLHLSRPRRAASSRKSMASFWVMGEPICTAVAGAASSSSMLERRWRRGCRPCPPGRRPSRSGRRRQSSFPRSRGPANCMGITAPVPQYTSGLPR
jgi:hypothetical protein